MQVEQRTPCAQLAHTHTRRGGVGVVCVFFREFCSLRAPNETEKHAQIHVVFMMMIRASMNANYVICLLLILVRSRLLSTADLSDRHFDSVSFFFSISSPKRTDKNIGGKHDFSSLLPIEWHLVTL